jgi:hypothetical protein
MSISKPLAAVAAFAVLICIFTLVTVQAHRAYQPQPSEPISSAAIFEKGKRYTFLFEEGLARVWVLCDVQEARDNWVKCDGGFYKDNKIDEKMTGVWINTHYVLRTGGQ